MATVTLVDEEQAQGEAKEAFDELKEAMGISKVPNTFRQMAQKPKFLKTLLAMDSVVYADDTLDAKTKHLMAVAVSAAMGCEYCVYAHAALAQKLGASEEQVAEALTVAAVNGAFNNFNKATGLEKDILPPAAQKS
jgi:AhpD family alkylhydroperoxidase